MRYLGLVACWAVDVSERHANKGERSIKTATGLTKSDKIIIIKCLAI